MKKSKRTSQIVRKNIYILIVVIVFLSVSSFIYFQWTNQKSRETERVLREYHLTTISLSSGIRGELFHVNNHLLSLLHGKHKLGEIEQGDTLSVYLFNIQKDLKVIFELQHIFKYPEYKSLLEKVKGQWNVFSSFVDQQYLVNMIPKTEIEKQVSLLLISIDQLQRLHTIQYHRFSSKLLEQKNRNTVFTIIVFVITLAIGFTFISSILVTIKKIMLDQERDEATLSKSEASLSEAQRIAHLGSWDWDIVNNKLHWSDEIYSIFRLKPQEFGATYEAFLNSVHPDDRELVKKTVNNALHEKKPYSINHRIVLPDDTERIVHAQAEVTFDQTGKPTQMIGTVQDITERKRTEMQIEKINRLNKDLLCSGNFNEKIKLITNSIVKIFRADFTRIWSIKPGDQCDSGCIHTKIIDGTRVCSQRDLCLTLLPVPDVTRT